MADHRLEIVLAAKDITATAFASVTGRVKALTSGIMTLQGSLLTLAGGYGFSSVAGSALETAKAFERYEVQLKTLTGSQEAAQAAMEWISDFTRTTPYELDAVTTAFAKLTAYGVDARTWLATLGDTAGSMGKSLNDAVEMLADALTGEFERLKEFGVRASQSGDQVTFSWRQNGQDMVLTAEKTQSGISNALGRIFTRFQGGMAEQSKTLDGLWSNFLDTWTAIERKVMAAGILAEIKSQLDDLTQAMGQWVDQNDALIQQKVPEYIESIKASILALYQAYQSIPSELVSAAGYGMMGRLLFGSWGPAKIVAGVALINETLKSFRSDLGTLWKDAEAFNDAVYKMWEVISGRRDFNTGAYTAEYAPRLSGAQVPDDIWPTSDDLFKNVDAELNRFFSGLQTSSQAVVQSTATATASVKAFQEQISDYYQKAEADAKAYITTLEAVDAALDTAFSDLDAAEAQIRLDVDLAGFFEDLDAQERALNQSMARMITLSQRTEDAIEDGFSSFFYNLKDGFDDLGDAWESVVNSMWQAWSNIMGQLTAESLLGTGSGWSGLFSTLLTSTTSTAAPVQVGATANTAFKMANGGYLGEGIIGIGRATGASYEFHPNEYVVPQNKVTAGATDIRVNVTNNTRVQATPRTQVRETSQGLQIDVVLDEVVAGKLSQRGTATSRALRHAYGARPQLVVR